MGTDEQCMQNLAMVVMLFMAKMGIHKISFDKKDVDEMDSFFPGQSLIIEGSGFGVEVSMMKNADQYIEQIAEGRHWRSRSFWITRNRALPSMQPRNSLKLIQLRSISGLNCCPRWRGIVALPVFKPFQPRSNLTHERKYHV